MWKKLAGGVAFVAVAAALTPVAFAQVTTSGVQGTVSRADGSPAADATVVVEDTRTGLTRTVVATPTGAFDIRGLNVGGPYTISVSAPGEQPAQVTDVFLNLGAPTAVNLAFSGATAGDVVVVTASQAGTVQTAIGPTATFTLEDLQTAPAPNRDLKDIVRLDPRIQLDEGFVDAVQCAGAHPRFNSLTVDGIGLNDGFGLNSNGYPTERMPFPYDAVQNVSVELAPFDVQYGFFTGCNINAVTQSGTNEFHGSLFFDYTDDSLTGDKVEGSTISVPAFEEKRYGATIGGPIIKDRLFFFAAYEKFEGVNVFGAGPEGSGAALEIVGLTQAEVDRIRQAAIDVYGYDPGDIPQSSPTVDEKYLLRLDWNISDRHRASLTYNYNEGSNLTRSDDDPNELEFAGHFYQRGAELKAYSGQLFSDWTDNFSTEVRVAYNEVDATVRSQFGTDFGEVQIRDSGNIVYLGADDSRHANDLDYSTLAIKAAGNYRIGDHVLTFGAERTSFDIFNLFVQETEGEWRFNSISDFENGLVERVIYENAAPSNDPNDAAATFKYDVNTIYLQDEWSFDEVTLSAGLRYDWYTSDDRPVFNPNFLARNGFRNDETMDGKSLLQPRIAFTLDVSDALTVRGGFGLFSGGNPNVWISNNYSNNGVTQVEQVLRVSGSTVDLFDTNAVASYVEDEGGLGRPIWGIPVQLYNGVATGSANSAVNALDPDFEIPATWKTALGFTLDFDLPGFWGDGYRVNGDLLYAKDENSAIVRDLSLQQIGVLPDGRPRYRRIDRSDPDCAAAPAAAACTSRGFNNDFVLTNSTGGEALTLAASLDKSYDFGLDWSLGYAFIDAKDVNPMTSSVAFSNWSNIGVSDPERLSAAPSNYETPHNITLRVSYENEFFGDFVTRFTLFGRAYQARPYAFTFTTDDGDIVGDNANDRHLLYVPTVGDPRVVYGPNFDQAAFNSYIERYGLARGRIDARNSHEGTWQNKFDLRVEQELPGILADHRTSAFLVIENIGNLLNDDWGTIRQAGFPQNVPVVDASYSTVTNQYTYQEFFPRDAETLVNNQFQSVWSVRVGVKYDF
jgi:hypothetical protein